LFRLAFIAANHNIVFISNVGLGTTHISLALGHAACIGGHSVLFTTAVDIINTLAAAQSAGRLKREIGRYLKPRLLIIDELGYLPIDKHGADLLFQIISQRYERAPMLITTNRAYKHWSQIFNNDSTLTSAIPRPCPAPRRYRHHRGQELPHPSRNRRLSDGARTPHRTGLSTRRFR
jgi:DNA replication protein DnaC